MFVSTGASSTVGAGRWQAAPHRLALKWEGLIVAADRRQ